MSSILAPLSYQLLTHAMQSDTITQLDAEEKKLTRRGFLLLSAALTSCSAALPLEQTTPFTSSIAPVMPPTSPEIRDKNVQSSSSVFSGGTVPRNPDMALSSDFSKGATLTFTRVPIAEPYIAITFDDGPHPQNTPRLLEMLRARNIKATFYVIGRSVEAYPNIVQRTVAEGHEIGNHSQTHRLLSKLGDSELRNEMRSCQNAVERAAGVIPKTMRPPYGGLLTRQRQLIHSEFGLPTILWSVDPLDWKRPGASVVTSRILSGTRAGGIVLAHDLHAQTIDAMPATLDGLLRRGFKFVTVSELLAMQA